MIFEMVTNCLKSLAGQWDDLARDFQRLAASLKEGTPGRESIGNYKKPHPARAPNPSLQFDCQEQHAWLNGEIKLITGLRPASDLFVRAIRTLKESEDKRAQVDIKFKTLIKTLADAPLDTVETQICSSQLEQLREAIAHCVGEFEEVISPEGERFSIQGIKGSVEHLASFPLLTADHNFAPAPSPPATGGVSLQRVIEGAMREVLGRLPKPRDTRSFLTSLNQSFAIAEVEGHTEFTWTPRSYAGQTDLGGGVTGAQASLAARGQVALDNSLPLLNGLYPLLPDADMDEVEAARAIVVSELRAIVGEFGIEGGPRVQRVDAFFDLLLDGDTTGADGKLIRDGKLGYLQEVCGLKQGQVNTLDEELNVTNFIVLRDYVESLRRSWESFRDTWFGKDLGTRLVLLGRALSVVSEAVNEVYAAMDSVFVGPAERQVASFRATNGRPMLVEELLSWITTFASDEAPRLVYEGGRRGVEALVPTALTLEQLVQCFLDAITHEPSLPAGLRHPRVRHPLQELRSYLLQTRKLAEDVRRP